MTAELWLKTSKKHGTEMRLKVSEDEYGNVRYRQMTGLRDGELRQGNWRSWTKGATLLWAGELRGGYV